jgi:hypothetical protein
MSKMYFSGCYKLRGEVDSMGLPQSSPSALLEHAPIRCLLPQFPHGGRIAWLWFGTLGQGHQTVVSSLPLRSEQCPITLRYNHSNAVPSQFVTLLDHMNPGARASDLSLFTRFRSEKCPSHCDTTTVKQFPVSSWASSASGIRPCDN